MESKRILMVRQRTEDFAGYQVARGKIFRFAKNQKEEIMSIILDLGIIGPTARDFRPVERSCCNFRRQKTAMAGKRVYNPRDSDVTGVRPSRSQRSLHGASSGTSMV